MAVGVEGSVAVVPTEFRMSGAHLGDLLLALPAIGAALRSGPVVVSGLEPRHFTALRRLPCEFRHVHGGEGRTLRPRFQPGEHRTVAWLRALGDDAQPVRVPVPVHGLQQARTLLQTEGWALLSVWADHASKRWPLIHWAMVARGLQARGFQVALIGPAQSRDLESVRWPPGVRDLRGMDTPPTWPALLTRAALVVSLDTGCVHMADALGIPVAGLYGVADPAEYAPFWQRHACIHAPSMEEILPRHVMALIDARTER